ncbi:MAG: cytochrome c oxidase subunit II [Nitrospiraceae bacterium]|nr:MAG: cytochrome c oxidase subunit II [Nitrospiraceae bacterium]
MLNSFIHRIITAQTDMGSSPSAEPFYRMHIADSVMLFILAISVTFLVLVTFFMIYFVIKYRKERNPTAEQIEGNFPLEVIWTVIPTMLVIIMFYIGWAGFKSMRDAPENAMQVKVFGQMWTWQFEYTNGRKDRVLRVPVGKPVRLTLASRDVLHSLYLPDFRIKEDLVPRMTNYLWFAAKQPGLYRILCTEYCGLGHSQMRTALVAMTEEEFLRWYSPGEAGIEFPYRGREILDVKGCIGCHSLDGSKKIGPTFKGIYDRRSIVITSGEEREVITDEEYMRRSILVPKSDIVKGYPAVMPSYEGLLTVEEFKEIIDFLKGDFIEKPPKKKKVKTAVKKRTQKQVTAFPKPRAVKPVTGPEQKKAVKAVPQYDGKRTFNERGCQVCHNTSNARKIGPGLRGIYNRKVVVITNRKEREIVSDEVYLKRSILKPKYDIVKGYPLLMPSQAGFISDEELDALVEYLKTLK